MNLVLYLVIGLLLTFLGHCVERHEVSNCWHAPDGKAIVIAASLAGIILWPLIVLALTAAVVALIRLLITNSKLRVSP